jgi:hypothetical protein
MLAELEKSKGGGDSTITRMGKSAYKEVLDGAGLSYKKAAQWQQLAAIPTQIVAPARQFNPYQVCQRNCEISFTSLTHAVV